MIIRIITVQLPRYLTIDRRDINHGQSLACIYNDVTVMYNIIIVLYDNLDRAVYNVYIISTCHMHYSYRTARAKKV